MQVICSKTELNNAISMVQRAIASRSTISILEGILFSADDTLTLTGYDLETGIEALVHADIREKGSIVIKAKIFGDIVRKLPEENVVIKCDENLKLNIKCGQVDFTINAQAADEYPKIPTVEESQKINLPQGMLKKMIDQSIFAASSDESRPILNGVKVRAENDDIEMIAIDGFRLAVRNEKHDGIGDILDFIIPWKALNEVSRSVLDIEEEVAIFPSHNHILFETEDFRLVSRLLQGDFLDYKRIIPPSCTSRIVISAKEMLAAIERASLLINVEHRRFPVCLKSLSDRELEISAKTDVGTIEEIVPIELNGEMIDIDFNPKYFLDALRVIEDEQVYLEFSGPSAPCLIKPIEGNGFLYMLLPLRR